MTRNFVTGGAVDPCGDLLGDGWAVRPWVDTARVWRWSWAVLAPGTWSSSLIRNNLHSRLFIPVLGESLVLCGCKYSCQSETL